MFIRCDDETYVNEKYIKTAFPSISLIGKEEEMLMGYEIHLDDNKIYYTREVSKMKKLLGEDDV